MTTTGPRMKPIRTKLAAAAAACALLTTAAMASAGAASASAAPVRGSSAALRTALHRDLSPLPDHPAEGRAHLRGLAAGHLPRHPAGHQPGRRDHPLQRRAAGLSPCAVADRQQHQGLHRGDHAPARSRGQAVHQRPDREMAAPVPGLAPHHHPPAARHDQPHPRLHLPARLHRRVRREPGHPFHRRPAGLLRRRPAPRAPPDTTTPTPITSSPR